LEKTIVFFMFRELIFCAPGLILFYFCYIMTNRQVSDQIFEMVYIILR